MESSDIATTIILISLFILFGFMIYACVYLIKKDSGMSYDSATVHVKVSTENSEHEKDIKKLEGMLNQHWTINRVDTLNDGSLLYILERPDYWRYN